MEIPVYTGFLLVLSGGVRALQAPSPTSPPIKCVCIFHSIISNKLNQSHVELNMDYYGAFHVFARFTVCIQELPNPMDL